MISNDAARVLHIGDQHAPYHHRDTLTFLEAVRDHYLPTLVINQGDEVDQHAVSFHDKDPNLPGAAAEDKAANRFIRQLEEIFPRMYIMESNHGSRVQRKAYAAGIPAGRLRTNNEYWGVSDSWVWVPELVYRTPGGTLVYSHHGTSKGKNPVLTAQAEGKCAVLGHYHSEFGVKYWQHSTGRLWGANTGCLVDRHSRAFLYGKDHRYKPVLGSLMTFDGEPHLIPMLLKKSGRWNGRLV